MDGAPLSNMQARDVEALLHPYTNAVAHRKTGPHIIESGQGIYVFDDSGKRFIEGMSGLWCAGLGFGDEELLDAAREQLGKLPYYHLFGGRSFEPAIELAERIKDMAPVPVSKVIYQSSGSEANDTQIKLAWYYNNARGKPEKKKIIGRVKGYHGVTIAAASLTGLPYNHRDFDLPAIPVIHLTCPHYWKWAEPGESEADFTARLLKEAESNVAIKVTDTPGGEAFEVAGRGELQMGVLIENMRREGFELSISRPQVLFREIDGQRMEPIEEATIDVDDEYTGAVVEKLTGARKGELVEMKPAGAGKTRIVAHVPSRGLIGYHGEFLTDTRGTGVLNRVFHDWAPHKGPIPGRRAGVLISMENGEAVAYALWNLEERGRMFVGPQAQVYTGMIIGEHSRDNDLEVNPLKGKKLTNVRASGSDDAVRLTPHIEFSLEEAIAYINDDELVEVTPNVVRLRKRYLDPHERKRMAKASQ